MGVATGDTAVGEGVTIWQGCYDDSWRDLIQDKSIAHPAKFQHGLIKRIFQHGLDKGWWAKGDVIGDCFGGIGTGGVVAGGLGLRWVGVELEPRFVRMAAGYDCPGVSKPEWVRWWGRYERNPDLCPQCQLGFGRQVDRPLLSDGDGQYYGDGVVPWVAPHHYAGNGVNVIQGDSREFASLVGAVDSIVTSPPFQDSLSNKPSPQILDGSGGRMGESCKSDESYGHTPGQIGAMKPGKVDGIVASPPYADSVKGTHGETETAKDSRDARNTPGGSLGQSQRHGGYGVSDGNIGNLKEGQLDAVVTSPPYANSPIVGRCAPQVGTEYRLGNRPKGAASDADTGYGQTPGNIGNLPEGKLQGIVTSPPFSEPGSQPVGKCPSRPVRSKLRAEGIDDKTEYGYAPGQIGNDSGDTYWEAVRAVYQQCCLALKPGGVMCVVVKDYVKAGKKVPLCDQTATLLESLGFQPVERIRASLVAESVQDGLWGEDVVDRKERKSFFRRLAESKGSPPIDFEEVICVRTTARKETDGR